MYWYVEAADVNTRERATSGGAIRTLVNELLVRKYVTRVIMTCSKGCDAATLTVDAPSETLPSTWYSYNASLVPTVLSEIAGKDDLMIIALPCQARIIREITPNSLIVSPVCFQTLDPSGIRKVLNSLGIDCEEAKSIYRVHDDLIIQSQNSTRSIPFKAFWDHFKFNQYSNRFCRSCKDHLGNAADITLFDKDHRANIMSVRTRRGLSLIREMNQALRMRRSVFARIDVIWKILAHSISRLVGIALAGLALFDCKFRREQ